MMNYYIKNIYSDFKEKLGCYKTQAFRIKFEKIWPFAHKN